MVANGLGSGNRGVCQHVPTARRAVDCCPFPILPASRSESMLGSPMPRRLDEPIAVSLEDQIPADHFYRHLEATLGLGYVRDWTRGRYAERTRPGIDLGWLHRDRHRCRSDARSQEDPMTSPHALFLSLAATVCAFALVLMAIASQASSSATPWWERPRLPAPSRSLPRRSTTPPPSPTRSPSRPPPAAEPSRHRRRWDDRARVGPRRKNAPRSAKCRAGHRGASEAPG